MKKVKTIGKILYALPLLIFGMMHFMKGGEMSGMLQNWPAALFFVYLSGAGLVLAAVSIIINKYTRLASLLLAVELLLIIVFMQIPGLMSDDPMTMQMAMMMTLKDMGLMGGALIIAAISDK